MGFSPLFLFRFKKISVLSLFSIVLICALMGVHASDSIKSNWLHPYPPGDIDQKQLKALEKAQRFAEIQHLFDVFAWRTFIALNWPADSKGTPDKNKRIGQVSKHGLVWEHWAHEFEVFTPNGQPPQISPGLRPRTLVNTGNTAPDILDESLEAFKGPLVDQNGNWAHYEIRMSPQEVAYLLDNGLYYVQGQVAFSGSGKKVVFPQGVFKGEIGAIEVKAAWKVIDEKQDIPSRFYTVIADIIIDDPTKFNKKVVKKGVTMGLVGMHISAKTRFADQWIWGTWEHVDNLQVPDRTIGGKVLKPSFNNPNCEICPVNIQPAMNVLIPGQPVTPGQTFNGWDPTVPYEPTQVLRLTPIPIAKQDLNRQVQQSLRAAVRGSVWQYYELIDTQWPTSPSTAPTPPLPFDPKANPNSVSNKPGGLPTPVYLVNSIMETYFQAGNQPASNQIDGMPVAVTTPIFGTESCMGCHFSAGIAIQYNASTGAIKYGPSASSDFSWLLQQKAYPRVDNPKSK